jgi:hypothetical protein
MKFAAVNVTGGMPTCNYCAEPDACEPYVEPQGSGTDLNGSGSCIHLGGGVYQWITCEPVVAAARSDPK